MFKKFFLILSLIMVVGLVGVNIEAGPAPPLSYIGVYAVRSEKQPTWEYFKKYQMSSVKDHGGKWMEIVTIDVGYGHCRYAEMNGKKVTLIKTVPYDSNGDSIVDGFYCYWSTIYGTEQGTFFYKNTSANAPWNTLYSRTWIR